MNNYELREIIFKITNQTLINTKLEKYAKDISNSAIFTLKRIGEYNSNFCLERDDYVSVVWETLEHLKQVISLKPELINNIKGYCQITFKNRLLSYTNKFKGPKHKVLNEFIQYDEDYLVHEYIENNFASKFSNETTIKNYKLSTKLKYIDDLQKLKPKIKNVGMLLMEGKTIKEVAKETNYSTRQINRIKSKLIELVNNNNLD